MTLAYGDKEKIQAHKMLLSMGGRLGRSLCDSSGEEEAKPPDMIVKMLMDHGEHGIVVDGIIAWVAMNREMTAENILKQFMQKQLTLDELLKSRAALRASGGPELQEWFEKLPKTRSEMKLAVEDIVKAMTFLTESKKMPLILAGPEQIRRCPGAGSSSQTASVELESKIQSLEKSMNDFMDSNKKQIEALTVEVKKATVMRKAHVPPEIQISTPGKKRKTSEVTSEGEVYITPAEVMAAARPTFSQVAMAGVQTLHPPGRNLSPPQPVTQKMMREAIEKAMKTKVTNKAEKPKGRNVFHGNSAETEASNLAADVDLVASGVARDASAKQLEDFLKAKGINVIKVECLTKPELVAEEKVRSKTMKVTVKAAELEKAMDPGVWPYRVGVRHFRAPQRPRQGAGDGSWASQSAQSGGRLDNINGRGNGGQGWRQQQNQGIKIPSRRQQQSSQPTLELLNMWASLGEQPAP